MSAPSVRLVNTFVPTRYDVTVRLDIAAWRFAVEESIHIKKNDAATASGSDAIVTLHCGKMIKVTSVAGAEIESRDEARDTITLKLATVAAEQVIKLTFDNEITEEMRGMYRVTYTHDGAVKRMASTHFEPVGARRFFVCLDEPAARATFALRVILPGADAGLTVLSNGPTSSISVDPSDGSCVHTFEPVECIPPYLAALAAGELECVETTSANGTPVRFFTTRGTGAIAKAKFGLEIASFSLTLFEKLFKCPYPYKKLDLIAVPNFPIGGMENIGCITLATSVLVDEASSSLAALKSASSLISHEVSHMWFGDAVGIAWWEGLWLKEGFASYLGYVGTSHFRPSWMTDVDVADEIFAALKVDGTLATHPVEAPINDPADITQVFDLISYCKGMAVVAMLKKYLGDAAFEAGIAAYVAEYRHKNTTTSQLWDALERSSGMPITSLMSRFTKSPGHPTVFVEFLDADRKPTTGTGAAFARVTQQKYALAINKGAGDSCSDTLWTVPIILRNSAGLEATFTLDGVATREFALPVEWASTTRWIKANAGHLGFFRTAYPSATLSHLLAHLRELPDIDQMGLQNDAFALFDAGELTADDLLGLLVVYSGADSYGVLSDYLGGLAHVLDTFAPCGPNVKAAMLRRGAASVIPLATSLFDAAAPPATGGAAELAKFQLLRRLSVSAGVRQSLVLTDQPTAVALRDLAASRGADYVLGNSGVVAKPLDADILPACVTAAVATSDRPEIFDKVWAKYLNEVNGGDIDVARSLLRALCASRRDEHFDFVMNELLGVEPRVQNQYGAIVFDAFAANDAHSSKVWPTFQTFFTRIDQLWGGGQFRIQRIVESVGSTLTGDGDDPERFLKFFETHPLPNAAQSIQRAAEGMRLRAALRAKLGSAIVASLAK